MTAPMMMMTMLLAMAGRIGDHGGPDTLENFVRGSTVAPSRKQLTRHTVIAGKSQKSEFSLTPDPIQYSHFEGKLAMTTVVVRVDS